MLLNYLSDRQRRQNRPLKHKVKFAKLYALHTACERGHIEVVRAFLQSPHFVEYRGDYVEQLAKEKLNEEIDRLTPLGRACMRGHVEVAKVLVEHEADPNCWLNILNKIEVGDTFKEDDRSIEFMLDHPDCLDYFFGTLKGLQVSSPPPLSLSLSLSLSTCLTNFYQ